MAAKAKYDETDNNRQTKVGSFYKYMKSAAQSKNVRQNILEKIPADCLTINYDPCNDGNEFLLKFLRAGNHNVAYATQILSNYIQESIISAKYSKNSTNMEIIRHVYEAQVHIMLEHRDKYGRRVYIWRPGKWNPDKINICDCYCGGYMLCEMIAREPMTQICGCTVITDAQDFGFKQFRQFSIQDIKAFSTFMQVSFHSNMFIWQLLAFIQQGTTKSIISLF